MLHDRKRIERNIHKLYTTHYSILQYNSILLELSVDREKERERVEVCVCNLSGWMWSGTGWVCVHSGDRRPIHSSLSKHIHVRMRILWNRFYNTTVTPPKSSALKGPLRSSLPLPLHLPQHHQLASFCLLFLHHESEEQEDQFKLFCKEQWEAWRLWRL